jgi:hypothetical protein
VQVARKTKIIKIIPRNRTFKLYADKIVAVVKSPIPNAGNTVRYGYAGKACATSKAINADNAAPYGKAGKAGATSKSVNLNAGNAVRNDYAGKAGAT